MDLDFKKRLKLGFSKNSVIKYSVGNFIRAEQSFISYNYTKLTYIYAACSPTHKFKLAHLQVLNGPLLVIFSEYSKVLRKSILPWLCAVRLAKKTPTKDHVLILKPFSLRHRRVLRGINSASNLILVFRWSSPFYRVRRIKRWLSKKYTNKLWR